MHIKPACAFDCKTISFSTHFPANSFIPQCRFLSIFSPLCHVFFKTLILMSSSALTLLFCYSSPNFFTLSHLQSLLSHHPSSTGSISPIHRGVSFSVILFVCSSFLTPSVQEEHTLFFFPAEVLIRRDSQFNYFYSGARPRESCSFSLSSYIFYLFSVFPPIFLLWLSYSTLILPLLLSSHTAFALSPLHSSSHHCPFLLSRSSSVNINIWVSAIGDIQGESVTRIISMLISLASVINKFTLTNTQSSASEDWTRSFFILASLTPSLSFPSTGPSGSQASRIQ